MSDHPTNDAIDLMDGQFYRNDPHPQFAWMREHAPVYWDDHAKVWGITLHEDVMACSKDSGTYCNGQGMRPDVPPIPSMINMDRPEHMRRRNLVNRGFTPRRVEEMRARVLEVCHRIVDAVCEKGACDFVRDIAAPLPMIMIGDMLGVREEDHDDLLRWSDDMIAGTSTTVTPEIAERAGRAFLEYAEYNAKVVADRRSKPPADDLMSVLVHAEIVGDHLDDEALLQESLLILIGGDETTRHVISGGMRELLRNPAQRDRLLADPAGIPMAVEEMLRWVTPIQNMARTVTRDHELRGQRLREGDKLLLLYPSANRDERVFARPFEFDIRRDPNLHVAFGGYGAHHCLGKSLARLELHVMFQVLLERLPDLAIADQEALEMRPSNFIVGLEHMPVTYSPSAPRG